MMTSSGYGRSMIVNLKELKCPEEGGTKQQHDTFLDKIKAHFNVSWMYGGLLVKMIEDKEDPDFTLMIPADLPATGVSEGQKMIWKEKVKVAGAKKMVHEENKMALFSLVFTHLSKITQSKIEGTSGYESANSSKDPLWLLSALDDVMIGFEKVKSPIVAMYDQLHQRKKRVIFWGPCAKKIPPTLFFIHQSDESHMDKVREQPLLATNDRLLATNDPPLLIYGASCKQSIRPLSFCIRPLSFCIWTDAYFSHPH